MNFSGSGDLNFIKNPFCYCKQVFTSAVWDLRKEVRDCLYQWRQITLVDVWGNIELIGAVRTNGAILNVSFIGGIVLVKMYG